MRDPSGPFRRRRRETPCQDAGGHSARGAGPARTAPPQPPAGPARKRPDIPHGGGAG